MLGLSPLAGSLGHCKENAVYLPYPPHRLPVHTASTLWLPGCLPSPRREPCSIQGSS